MDKENNKIGYKSPPKSTQFKKGNKAATKKGERFSIKSAVREFLLEGNQDRLDSLLNSLFVAATMSQDVAAAKLLLSYGFGNPAPMQDESAGSKLTVTFEQDDSPAPEPENLDDEEA